MKSAALFALTLSALFASAPAFAPTVEIHSNGQTFTFDAADVRNIQIKADKINYDAATSMLELAGKTKVNVNENNTHFTHLEDNRATVRASEHLELQIDAGSSIEADQDAPIRELAAALQRAYPPMNYRVQWRFSVFQFYSEGTALYDRRDGTLSEYIREGDEDSGGIYQRFYRGVTDKVLIQMAKDIAIATKKADAQGSTKTFDFLQLTKYGCTVVDVN